MEYRNVEFSRLRFRVEAETTTNNMRLSWNSEEHMKYELEESDDLLAWSSAGIVSTGTGARLEWPIPADSKNRMFYRLKIIE